MPFIEELQNDILPFLAEEAPTAALLKRILLFLEDEEFIQADIYCEKVLDTEPENPLAYLCKLMASRRISSLKDLASAQYIVDDDSAFQKAVRFAPEKMQAHLHQLNMHIYAGSIQACRSRAKIHLAHGELKETAQQYHSAMKMWEDSHEDLPDADAVYSSLANEIADFNWTLLLHHRQCSDDKQLIARSIPVDSDRWYLSAVKWADAEKKAYFTSVAKDTLFNAHLKCLEYIKSKQTRLAKIWAEHYKAAATADDPLVPIHQALVDTDGFTKFSADAPGAMLALIKLYKTSNPRIAEEIKAILQDYYGKIFRALLDFTGKEIPATSATPRLDEDDYAILIAQQEANACAPEGKTTPAPNFSKPAEETATDPVWATETARKITGQMVEAVSEDLSPYSAVAGYLIAAKGLTIRYGRKDGIVTEPLLFRFICQYYTDAIALVQPEQVSAIEGKFNDFLLDTVRLPSASAEIVAEASAYMQGNILPYQIYLARITNNYSVKAEHLIPPDVTKTLEKWQQYLENADPRRDCYRISDKQEAICEAFASAEKAIDDCRQYTGLLQKDLDASYQQVLTTSGDGQADLSTDWNQKMEALQGRCDAWAKELEDRLRHVRELNSAKLELAQKYIKAKESRQLVLSIGMNLLLVLAVFAFGMALVSAIGNAWKLMDAYTELPQQIGFYVISILAPLFVGALSLANGMVAPSYASKNRQKLVWLFALFGALTYALVYLDMGAIIFFPETVESAALIATDIMALIGIVRTVLEFCLCKLGSDSRSHATQLSCHIGSVMAKVAGVAQWLVCLALAALYICCLILIL